MSVRNSTSLGKDVVRTSELVVRAYARKRTDVRVRTYSSVRNHEAICLPNSDKEPPLAVAHGTSRLHKVGNRGWTRAKVSNKRDAGRPRLTHLPGLATTEQIVDETRSSHSRLPKPLCIDRCNTCQKGRGAVTPARHYYEY